MSESGGMFVMVATYPDEAAAREDCRVVKDASGQVHQNKEM